MLPEWEHCFAEKEINAAGKGKAIGIECDVSDYSQVLQVCDESLRTFGSIDILVNFSGGYGRRMVLHREWTIHEREYV